MKFLDLLTSEFKEKLQNVVLSLLSPLPDWERSSGNCWSEQILVDFFCPEVLSLLVPQQFEAANKNSVYWVVLQGYHEQT